MAVGLTPRPAGRDAQRGSSPDPQIRGLETVRGMDSNGAHRLFWAGLALSGERRFVPHIGPLMSRLRWRMNTGIAVMTMPWQLREGLRPHRIAITIGMRTPSMTNMIGQKITPGTSPLNFSQRVIC